LGRAMGSKSLRTYLNDHLAGSVAAVELLTHLAVVQRATGQEQLFRTLRVEVEEDQRVLQQILDRMGEKESRMRKAAAWLTEKLGEAKLKLDDPGDGKLRLLEALESLALGIQGKLALWRALDTVADHLPEIRGLDLAHLIRRAVQQHDLLEAQRIEAARIALVS
jgi:hypothetical protein